MRPKLFLAGVLFSSSVSMAAAEDMVEVARIVEAIELTELANAGSVEAGLRAAGLDFWKIEPARAR